MLLLLDNFDSFTYNLVDYFEQLGQECCVIRNDKSLAEITKGDYKGVILSPGPRSPKEAGNLMAVLAYFHNRLPILGICLGHQAIGDFFGWKVAKALRPMHGKISKISHKKNNLFKGLPKEFNVVRYHSLVIKKEKNIKSPLEITAITNENEVMAIEHSALPICGIQFHPEAALTQFGLEILDNCLIGNQIKFDKNIKMEA